MLTKPMKISPSFVAAELQQSFHVAIANPAACLR
jgi:hypothetical protein